MGKGRSRASQRAAVPVPGATRQGLTIGFRRAASAVETALDRSERHSRGLTHGKAPIRLPIRHLTVAICGYAQLLPRSGYLTSGSELLS